MQAITGFRLSPQQERVWALQQSAGNLPFHTQCASKIEGPLDKVRLEVALFNVIERYEILHTTFHKVEGMIFPLQVISDFRRNTIPVCDLVSVSSWEREFEAIFDETGFRPFDFERDATIGSLLLRLSPDRHILILHLPALCADAQTLDIIVGEIARAYAGLVRGDEQPTEEPLQYADLAEWQIGLLESDDTLPGRDYWSRQDISPALSLTLPFQRRQHSGGNGAFDVGSLSVELSPVTTAALNLLAARFDAPVSLVLQACWQVLLWRLTRQPEITVGAVFDGRLDEDLRQSPGLFSRCLPIAARLEEGQPFSQVLANVVEVSREAAKWQECFRLGNYVKPNGHSAGVDFFPVCFESRSKPSAHSIDGVTFSIYQSHACTDRFNLKLSCVVSGECVTTNIYYERGLFLPAAVSRLAEQLHTLIEDACEAPDSRIEALRVVGANERELLLFGFNDTASPYPADKCLSQLFEEQVERAPEKIALRANEGQLTYAELNARANRLARYLARVGVSPESLVGIYLERSPDMVVAILGTLKAGAAYVPLDASYPQDRIALMLEDADPALVLTSNRLAQALATTGRKLFRIDSDWGVADETDENPVRVGVPDNLAYVIYTSGSTGRPKGVMVTHCGLVNYLSWCTREYEVDRGIGTPVHSPVGFDLTVTSLFSPLLVGGTVILVGEDQAIDGLQTALLDGANLSLVKLTPAHLDLLGQSISSDEAEGRTRAFIIGGEALLEESLSFWRAHAPGTRLINEYGPTETVVGCCVYDASASEPRSGAVPIGKPIANTQIYLLDGCLEPVPLGVEGELYIGGVGVARGYLNMADLTADRFIPDPFSGARGARLYKTGDVGRYYPDGNIEFVGRTDDQVKVRGYRIELGEIESVLKQHPAVQDAAVALRENSRVDKRIAAFIVPDQALAPVVRKLLSYDESGVAAGDSLYELPNRMRIFQNNKGETEYLYKEIFGERAYLQHGIKLKEGACIFDVGANIGMFTLFVAQHCDGVKVYAFEPIPATFDILRRNVELYGINARLFPCGLSNRPGEATFFHYPHLSLMSGRFADVVEEIEVVKRFELNQQGFQDDSALRWNEGLLDELLGERLACQPVSCHLRSLSEIIRAEGIDTIDLLKIDAEKSELPIFEGINQEDWPKIKQVVVEVHDIEDRLERVLSLLREQGFEVELAQETYLKQTNLHVVFGVRPVPEDEPVSVPATGAGSMFGWHSLEELIESIRAFLRKRLPEYMIPAEIDALDSLPLSRNGKVDRQALARRVNGGREKTASRLELKSEEKTPAEEMLAGIWSQVLGRERVGAGDNFFELGGHSLLATQVMSRVREVFKAELPLRSIFEAPTVAELARLIESRIAGGLQHDELPIEAVPRDGDLPLSFAQQRLWLMDQIEPGIPIYNIHVPVRLTAELDVVALKRTVDELLRRHEVLRTTFVLKDEGPVQVIAPPRPTFMPIIDLSQIDEQRREGELLRIAHDEAALPFNLANGPLMRVRLLRLGPQEHALLFTLHHIVGDGWSMSVLVKEVAALYSGFSQGSPVKLPELTIQYADFAHWQRRRLEGGVLEGLVAYWKDQLRDLPSMDLPSDRPRPPALSFRGGRQRIILSEGLTAAIKSLSVQEGATLFMTLLAAFQALLHRYSGQEDIVVGSNIAGRNRKEIEGLIGFFVNNLVLRTDLSGNLTFRQLLGRVRDVCLNAYAHQDMPFDLLVEELQPDRSLSHNPLFQVMFNLQNVPASNLELPGLTLTSLNVHTQTSRFDLTLNMWDAKQMIVGSLEYSTDLFNDGTITRMLDYFQMLLEEVTADPDKAIDDITLMTVEESGGLIDAFNEV
jgi:amino acid adenylation domain-containing protein/FkbM family methyltransferase